MSRHPDIYDAAKLRRSRRLAEARAWRRAAKRLDATPAGTPFYTHAAALGVDSQTWWDMSCRVILCLDLDADSAYDDHTSESRAACVLACLWLALDAEYEAGAAT